MLTYPQWLPGRLRMDAVTLILSSPQRLLGHLRMDAITELSTAAT
jgi:hypothetical protein